MKAVVFTEYGLPDVLELKEVEKPIPLQNEVLIKIHAASINSWSQGIKKCAELFPEISNIDSLFNFSTKNCNPGYLIAENKSSSVPEKIRGFFLIYGCLINCFKIINISNRYYRSKVIAFNSVFFLEQSSIKDLNHFIF